MLHEDGTAAVAGWPGDAKAAADLLWEWTLHNPQLAALERVNAMPKQGVSSTFKFGANYGIWQGLLAAYGVPHVMPTPREWQKGLVRKSDGPDPKSRSLAVARRLFPDVDLHRKKDSDKADALLLAWWAKQQSNGK
jgi:crossover junction endodeoxyribonuclease RuvC